MKEKRKDWKRARFLAGIPILVAIPLLWLSGCMWQHAWERMPGDGGTCPECQSSDLDQKSAPIADFTAELMTALPYGYVTRSEWADPNWDAATRERFNNPSSLVTPQLSLTHVVLHHTGGQNQDDWRARVRTIWREHTFSEGWGDIGYHFLVDPTGRVYEGRRALVRDAQGRLLVRRGAHTICTSTDGTGNNGTIGISFLGNFNDQLPKDEAVRAVVSLIVWVFEKFGISDPTEQVGLKNNNGGESGRILPRVTSHRALYEKHPQCGRSNTQCPGHMLHHLVVPHIRSRVADLRGCTQCGRITVWSPNGGESLNVGGTHTIRWTTTNVQGNVRVELSRDGGRTWTTIRGDIAANLGSATWTVTSPVSNLARIRVVSLTNTAVADASDANFNITCTYSLSPITRSFTHAGGSGSFTVTTQAGCSWTATTTAPWIRITSGTGTGTGTVRYTVDPNTSTAALEGSITVGDKKHEVNQAAPPAPTTFSISGTVRTNTGSALSGATVTLSGAASRTATTDGNGNYTFPGLANGNYTVTPSRSGYTFSPPNQAMTVSGSNRTGVNFTANPFDFSVSPNPSSGAVTRPTSGTVTVSTTVRAWKTAGPDTSVSFSVTGLPTGVTVNTATWNWALGDRSQSLIFSVSSSAATGTYDITIRGAAGTLTRQAVFRLTINAPTSPSVAAQIVSYNANPRQARVGQSVTLLMTLRNTGNTSWTFYGAVSLQRPNGTQVHLAFRPTTLGVGQEGTVSWTYAPDVAGSWNVVFGVWREEQQQNSLGHTGWIAGYIAVTATAAPLITVTSPNGGEVWTAGSTRTIAWTSSNLNPAGRLWVYYLYNGSWVLIGGPLPTTSTSFSWSVPSLPSTVSSVTTYVLVGNYVNGVWETEDMSDRPFTIAR